jgi:hypothetical protein
MALHTAPFLYYGTGNTLMIREMHMNSFLLHADDCMAMVIDIQEKLFAVMEQSTGAALLRNSRILLETAKTLDIPLIVTEQYPGGLGRTVPEIGGRIRGLPLFEKTFFSCCRDTAIRERIEAIARKTVIVMGIEAHVCVFQTVIDLLMAGYRVVVASDAVCSRRESDRNEALHEMRRAGSLVYSTEMIAFMLLEKAGTLQFKQLAPLFK